MLPARYDDDDDYSQNFFCFVVMLEIDIRQSKKKRRKKKIWIRYYLKINYFVKYCLKKIQFNQTAYTLATHPTFPDFIDERSKFHHVQ